MDGCGEDDDADDGADALLAMMMVTITLMMTHDVEP